LNKIQIADQTLHPSAQIEEVRAGVFHRACLCLWLMASILLAFGLQQCIAATKIANAKSLSNAVASSSSASAELNPSLWDAPSQEELDLKNVVDRSQILYGLKNLQTMQAMWKLSQYYLNVGKFSQADSQLRVVKDICAKNQQLRPVTKTQIDSACARAAAGMHARRGKPVYGIFKETVPGNLNFEAGLMPNSGGLQKMFPDLPSAWGIFGIHPEDYKVVLDMSGGVGGSKCALIEAKSTDAKGYATLIQGISPQSFLGKRVRMTGYVKTKSAQWAALWLKVEDKNGVKTLDNMSDRPITGTTDWTPYTCVLDVPVNCSNISFGGALKGSGAASFDNFKLEPVGRDTATSAGVSGSSGGAGFGPTNMDFEDGSGPTPVGWYGAGLHPEDYEVGLDDHGGVGGTKCGFVKAKNNQAKGFGNLMQSVPPGKLAGKRVRLSGSVKTIDAGRASLWIRIDDKDGMISLDNGNDRPITGTRDWTNFNCVLDVPMRSTGIFFGCILSGQGQVFFDNLKLEEAPNERTTALYTSGEIVATQSSNSSVGNSTATNVSSIVPRGALWEAPTAEELNYKRQMETSQVQNGFTHPQTMRAMWQLSQYYLKLRKFAQAEHILRYLNDASTKNPKNSPVTIADISAAYDRALVGMRKQTAQAVQAGFNQPAPHKPEANSQNGRGPFNLNFEQPTSSLLPPGWMIAGSDPGDYDFGLDKRGGRGSSQCSFIRAKSSSAAGFATLMQSCKASQYSGKRIRFSAFVKTSDAGKAQLWLRVDGPNAEMQGFDNMGRRPVLGTTDWANYECVLDVLPDSVDVCFGVILMASGQVWIDDAKIEEVGLDAPTTDTSRAR
jgi:hypothetical protein